MKTFFIHPMIATAAANANIRALQIEAVAKQLSDLMREAHGIEFQFNLDHGRRCAMIWAVDNSNSGEN